MPPKPGMSPRLTSGCPKRARSLARMKSQAHGKLAAAAQCVAVHRGDDRLWNGLDGHREVVAKAREVFGFLLAELGHIGDVRTRDEGLATRARQHAYAGLLVVPKVEERAVELRQGLEIQRIEHLGTVHSEGDDVLVPLVSQVPEGHGWRPFWCVWWGLEEEEAAG